MKGWKKLIRVQLYFMNINYDSLVEIAMPHITKWLLNKDNLLLELFSKVISKEGKPSRFSKFVLSLVPDKNQAATALLPKFQEVSLSFLNELLPKQGLMAHVDSIQYHTIERRQIQMLKIELDIDSIDYEHTIVNLTPIFLQQLKKQEGKAGNIAALLLSKNELPANVLRAAILAIPKEQRDELLAEIMMQYKEELIGLMNHTLEKNNLKANVNDIKIDQQ